MKYILIVLFLINSAMAVTLDERRQAIFEIIDQELSEVSRLSSQVQATNPDLLLRMAELYLEKARLYREAENEKYLAIDAQKRSSVNKSSYFRDSNKNFDRARNVCNRLLKKFPRYSKKADIYYILAFDAKERDQSKKAAKYFQLANRYSGKTSETKTKSQAALAEIYYNNREYRKAIPLYEQSLRKNVDRWWTKDSFNLAWCYYRIKRYDRAIDLMKNVYQRSSNSQFIDMSALVLRDIGLFYADSNKMDEGIRFYQSANVEAISQLVKVGDYLTSKGNFTSALKVYETALKYEKDESERATIMMQELELYEKFGRVSSHYKLSQELVRLSQRNILNSDQKERLKYHIDKNAAVLQKKTASNIYRNVKSTRVKLGSLAVGYFQLSQIMDPSKTNEKTFLQGETYFAMGYYVSALNKYIEAYDYASAQKDRKVMGDSLEGMLAVLGSRRLSSKTKDKYYEKVYTRYLAFDNNSKRAKEIHQKLFNVYDDKNDLKQAEMTLATYATIFPTDYKIQEAMLAKIMEKYRKAKNYTEVKRLVSDIDSKKYKVSAKYDRSVRKLLTNIQMEHVQSQLKSGKKKEALIGYLDVYGREDSTKNAKKNSAYNLAVLYYELGDVVNAYKWSNISLDHMHGKEVFKFEDTYITIASFLFERLQFEASSELSMKTLLKECRLGSRNKDLMFKNASFIQIADQKPARVEEYLKLTDRCGISPKVEAQIHYELAKIYAQNSQWDDLVNKIKILDRAKGQKTKSIELAEKLRAAYIKNGEISRAAQIERENKSRYYQLKKSRYKIPVESVDVIAEYYLDDLKSIEKQFKSIEVRFPENTFNATLKQKFSFLDKVTNSALKVSQTGSGRGIVSSYNILINCYANLIEQVENVKIENKSADYIKSFQASMSKVLGPIKSKMAQYQKELKQQINTYSILSDESDLVMTPQLSSQGLKTQYNSLYPAVIMDRRGR